MPMEPDVVAKLVSDVHKVMVKAIKDRGMVMPEGWDAEYPTVDVWCVLYEAVRSVLTSEIIIRVESKLGAGVPVLLEHMQQECKLVWDGEWRYADPLCRKVLDVVNGLKEAIKPWQELGEWIRVTDEDTPLRVETDANDPGRLGSAE